MRAADYLVDYLEKRGVKHIFLLPGGGNMYLVDAALQNENMVAFPMAHEQSVGVAADAYAQWRNNIAVALVTTGPGATNAITACAASWADSTPVLFISGQVRSDLSADTFGLRQRGFQETPITRIVSPITKKSVKLQNASEILEVVHELCELALDGRPGPVWLDVPLDLQSKEVDLSTHMKPKSLKFKEGGNGEDKYIETMLEVWQKSKRPVLLLGNGVRLAKGESLALGLIQKTNTPTLLTWKALDLLPETFILNAGRPGVIGQRWANFAQQDCDFLLSIGARIDTGQSAYRLDNFAPYAQKFIVDIDENELAKFDVNTWKTLECDAALFLNKTISFIENKRISINPQYWIKQIQEWKVRFPIITDSHLNEKDGVNLYVFIHELSKMMNSNDVFSPGSSGAGSEVSMQAFQNKKGQRVLNSEGLGPMGFGIPGAIGACVASDRRRTICIDGDGGFLMSIHELGTVAVQKLPIVFFVLNNNGYGSIKSTQDTYFQGRRIGTDPDCGLGLPNLERISDSFGIKYEYISENSEIKEKLGTILEGVLPRIVEVRVSPNQVTEPRVPNYLNANNELTTRPMEDMYPFLSISTLRSLLNCELSSEILGLSR
jgi:acetolactate synthase-1/2/3 large subunit